MPDAISNLDSWISLLVLGGVALLVVLLFAVFSKSPRHFTVLAIVQFFAISIIVVSFILSISFIPLDSIFPNFPISTIDLTIDNQTQWFLNIGGTPKENSVSGGLQIPIYIIISGILGSYIRYLYMGIKEFKKNHYKEIKNLMNAITQQKNVEHNFAKVQFDQHNVPADLKGYYDSVILRFEAKQKIGQQAVNDQLETLRMEVIHNTLESLGSIFLAPLLAVSAWLILVIGGTDNTYTFALVGFSVGLATERIVNSMRSIMDKNFGIDDKPATDKPATDKPATDKPATDKPATDKPATDKPATDKPATDKPATDKPASKPKKPDSE